MVKADSDVSCKVPLGLKNRLQYEAKKQLTSESAVLRKLMDDHLPKIPQKRIRRAMAAMG